MSLKGSDYVFCSQFAITEQMYHDYYDNGVLIIRQMFDDEEIEKIEKCVTGDEFRKYGYHLEEKEHKLIRTHWKHPGSDVTGTVARSKKIVNSCEKLLGGEVYHYHSKVILKEPRISGPVYWHQDYGYWYNYGNLFPDMITVFVAVDQCKKENGCLEALVGSNKCGRLDHHVEDGQYQIAETDRLEHIKIKCPQVYLEMEKGDAVFIHPNILHYSSPNRSEMRRLAFTMCYNKVTNGSLIEHHHAQYTPLQKVPDCAIKECTNFTDLSGKKFGHPQKNKTIIGRRD